MRSVLRNALLLFCLTACSLPSALAAPPPGLVLVTANPSASPTSTPFQPIGNQVAVDPPTLAATFTPLPPTDTPLPTLEFTATALAPPTAPAASARTQYTGKRATGADFFRVFHEHSAADLTDLFTKYFKNSY